MLINIVIRQCLCDLVELAVGNIEVNHLGVQTGRQSWNDAAGASTHSLDFVDHVSLLDQSQSDQFETFSSCLRTL